MYAVLSFTEQDIHFALDIEESVINFSKVNNDEEGISWRAQLPCNPSSHARGRGDFPRRLASVPQK